MLCSVTYQTTGLSVLSIIWQTSFFLPKEHLHFVMEISQDEIFILDPDMVLSQQAGTPPGMPDLVVEQASGWVCCFFGDVVVRGGWPQDGIRVWLGFALDISNDLKLF